MNATAAAVNARYTDPNAAHEWIVSAPNAREQLIRATRGVAIAENPQGRFGITEAQPAVAAVYHGFITDLEDTVSAVRDALTAAYRKYQAMDTAWHEVARDGFTYGDSALVGFNR
jgi:hypothetical protein